MGKKLAKGPDGVMAILDIKDMIPFGCQVEYTRIIIEGKEWFTFGLEWFGDTYLAPGAEMLYQLLGHSQLKAFDSEGYNSFLNKL